MRTKQYLLIIQDRESEGLDVTCQKLLTRDRPTGRGGMSRKELGNEIAEFLRENAPYLLDGEFDRVFAVNSILDAGAWCLNESYVMKLLKF